MKTDLTENHENLGVTKLNRNRKQRLSVCAAYSAFALAGADHTANAEPFWETIELKATVKPLPSDTSTYSQFEEDVNYRADPEILLHKGVYYCYSTARESTRLHHGRGALGFRCFSSTNLRSWKDEGMALNAADSDYVKYGYSAFWAPQVVYDGNEWFYLLYNCVGNAYRDAQEADLLMGGSPFQRICVARSRSPKGPYKEWAAPLMKTLPGAESGIIGQIDAFAFADKTTTGTDWYLFWSAIDDEHNCNLMWGAQLKPDFSGLLLPPHGPEPKLVLGDKIQDWERKACGERMIQEAASMIKRGDKYLMAYSANSFNMPEYSMGLAEGPTPLGPFTKKASNPFLKTVWDGGAPEYPLRKNTLLGPGGGSFFTFADGSTGLVFHRIAAPLIEPLCSNAAGFARKLNITKIEFTKDGELKLFNPFRKGSGQ